MESARNLLSQLPAFIEKVVSELESLGITNLHQTQIDHACYRVQNHEEYEAAKIAFTSVGKIISEALIGGRPIATVQLNEAVCFGLQRIPCIEIPAPKANRPYETGWEHCEFVIQESFVDFTRGKETLKWDWSSSQKDRNPELALRLSQGRSAKFHHQSLQEVIRQEELEKLGQ